MMTKHVLIIVILTSLLFQTKVIGQLTTPDNLVGSWVGNVKMGADYPRLVFEIFKDTANNLTGTVGSPDKGISGIPLSKILIISDSVNFEIEAASAVFKGLLSIDQQSISGLWQEGNLMQPVTLKSTTVEEIESVNLKKNIAYELQFSDDNFNFYSAEKDTSAIGDLAKTLNINYVELTKLMKTNFSDKIDIIIYPDIKAFHEAIYLENAPDWVVGAAGKNELKIVSPLNPGSVHTYESLIHAIVHELCHSIIINMRQQGRVGLPKWLDEGFAFYYAGQLTEQIKKTSFKNLTKSEIPTWNVLDKAETIEFGSINGYVFSASIIEFLVNKYGYEGIRQLILNPADFENIFSVDKIKLEKEWIDSLIKRR